MMDSNSNKSALKSFWNWWFTIPDELNSRQRRFFAIGALGIPQGLAVHLFYIFLFAYWGVWQLAIINVFSFTVWTGLIFVWRKQRLNLLYMVLYLEIVIHAAMVLLYLGWGFGMQYYLFVLLLVGFLLPWPRWINWSVTGLSTVLFVIFYYYTQLNSPLAVVPAGQLAIMNIFNIVSSFGISAAITLLFISVVEKAELDLEAEHAKSEALLHNVLPTTIASRLKQDDATVVDAFRNASILFADIAGFTPFSQKVSPEELVDILNTIFSRFDELVDEYGLEKIKTVGDEYMVASGIPTPRQDHAEALAYFALAMRESFDDYNRIANTNLQLRIGLNSGPVVAGVIGKRRFLYDLWGDSVNTASRMESHGQPGKIQISEATRQLLGEKFSVIDRGIVEIKGKGPMQTYFLDGHGDATPI